MITPINQERQTLCGVLLYVRDIIASPAFVVYLDLHRFVYVARSGVLRGRP